MKLFCQAVYIYRFPWNLEGGVDPINDTVDTFFSQICSAYCEKDIVIIFFQNSSWSCDGSVSKVIIQAALQLPGVGVRFD